MSRWMETPHVSCARCPNSLQRVYVPVNPSTVVPPSEPDSQLYPPHPPLSVTSTRTDTLRTRPPGPLLVR